MDTCVYVCVSMHQEVYERRHYLGHNVSDQHQTQSHVYIHTAHCIVRTCHVWCSLNPLHMSSGESFLKLKILSMKLRVTHPSIGIFVLYILQTPVNELIILQYNYRVNKSLVIVYYYFLVIQTTMWWIPPMVRCNILVHLLQGFYLSQSFAHFTM